jgi:hypothetical protein
MKCPIISRLVGIWLIFWTITITHFCQISNVLYFLFSYVSGCFDMFLLSPRSLPFQSVSFYFIRLIQFIVFLFSFRASLVSTFFHGISNFLRENELISFGKIKNTWRNEVPKLGGHILCNHSFWCKRAIKLSRASNLDPTVLYGRERFYMEGVKSKIGTMF